MLKFSFRRDKDKDFKHICHGLIPAASIAPKPAVPRTPPPRTPDPSPERPRSALAAAIWSSSLTGQTWALHPTRPRSFSESDRSESIISEPNSTANRERCSEDLASRPALSSPDHSEGELENKDESKEENEIEEHVYQTLDIGGQGETAEPVYALPIKSKVGTQQPTETSAELSSYDFTEETTVQSLQPSHKSFKRKESVRKSSWNKKDVPSAQSRQATHNRSQLSEALISRRFTQLSAEPNKSKTDGQRMEKRKETPEQRRPAEGLKPELVYSQDSSKDRGNKEDLNTGQAELQNLSWHAQELMDENDALKMTVHRLNVELSRYQVRFRPLSKEESAKISGLPMTDSPPPWLLDMKYLSPLLLAYDDRMKEKDVLMKTTEEEMKRLRGHVEEVIKENEKLHNEIAKIGGFTQKDWQQLQEQALLVLQENQALNQQLEAQHLKAKETQSKHHLEVSKLAKQLMMCEAENLHLQEDLEASKRELQKNMKNAKGLQDRLKDAVTWDEHCNITGKLRWQLEQQDNRNRSDQEELLLKVSRLQEENRSVTLDKANMAADIKRLKTEIEESKQVQRKGERKMSLLKQQKEESALKEEKIQHYLGAVVSVAEHISRERDQLLHMASVLKQEKQGFISNLLNGTVRFGKLHEEVKVYRRQASSKLAVLEKAAEGKTASYRREILHLQRLLRERQEAEERLLQSKREVEEELEVVWQATTRDNQQMREKLAGSRLSLDLGHKWVPEASDGTFTSTHRQLT